MTDTEWEDDVRSGWRDLGFFYRRDDDSREWWIIGSLDGLHRFAQLINDYASDSGHEGLSEHVHLGPHLYLEIGTWDAPQITDHWIAGPLDELRSLARHIESSIDDLDIGDHLTVRDAFAPEAPYDLLLERRDAGFDPPCLDTYL
jgi:hypothetical protein